MTGKMPGAMMTDNYTRRGGGRCRSCSLEAGTLERGDDPEETDLGRFFDHLDDIDRDQRRSERYGFVTDGIDQDDEVGFDAPLVFELGNIRSLLANWAYVQSAMCIDDPIRLVLDYTRAMMGFLLFNPSPHTIEIIGLGGGSLAKYCYRYLPAASIRAVEIDPEVLSVAERFCMPPEGTRFEIICDDGAQFARHDARSCDVMLVDGFDKDGQPVQLCSLEFYRDCCSRLNAGGVFVANLCDYAWKHVTILTRMRECFGRLIVVPVDGATNQIVFAFKERQPRFDDEEIRRVARKLDRTHMISFARLAEEILARSDRSKQSSDRIFDDVASLPSSWISYY